MSHLRRSANPVNARARARARAAGAFTIIELSVALAIIALLSAILLFAISGAVRTSRAAAEKQVCVSLRMACEQFKQQFGFLPPVIEEEYPLPAPPAPDNIDLGGAPLIVEDEGGAEGLQPQIREIKEEVVLPNPNFDQFKSVNSLAYYLVGAADKDIDGVDGPGFTIPIDASRDREEGHFEKRGKAYPALFDVTKDRKRLVRRGTQNDPRLLLIDRWGQPLRYYRWEPSYYPPTEADPSLRGTIRKNATGDFLYNVPSVIKNSLGDPANVPELRRGGFAIVSAGPDAKFSDQVSPANPEFDKDNILEIGR